MSKSQEAGFSLIELMIALLLSTVLIGGLVGVFFASSQNYRLTNALSEVQDKGRYAIKKVRADLLEAGFELDATVESVKLILAADSSGSKSCAPNTDVLEIYKYHYVDGDPTDKKLHRVCYYLSGGDLRRNVILDTINNANVISRKNISNASKNAAEVVVSGVGSWQVSFAVDQSTGTNADDGSVDVAGGKIYNTAAVLNAATANSADPEWREVLAVKIDFLMASNTENVTDQAQNFSGVFAGFVPANSNLYQAFSAIVGLRNRIR